MTFCRWLSDKLGYIVRLPKEFEWQQAATGGDEQRDYPWGAEWDTRNCNIDESRLNRTTEVGLYTHGTWPGGPLDLAGNVWEWCLNKYKQPSDNGIDSSIDSCVLRGISWFDPSDSCRETTYRTDLYPGFRHSNLGFRLLHPSSNGH